MAARKATVDANIEFGRILERLNQQDVNTALVATQLQRATSDIAMHLRESTANIASDLRESTARIAADLEEHTVQDNDRFKEIHDSLKQLLDYQTQQKGGVKIILWLASGLGAVLAIVVAWVSTVR